MSTIIPNAIEQTESTFLHVIDNDWAWPILKAYELATHATTVVILLLQHGDESQLVRVSEDSDIASVLRKVGDPDNSDVIIS